VLPVAARNASTVEAVTRRHRGRAPETDLRTEHPTRVRNVPAAVAVEAATGMESMMDHRECSQTA